MPPAVFDRDDAGGPSFVATALARGPWDPGACHGGAPAALLAGLIDAAPSRAPMECVRLTFDLERPVPIDVPLHSSVEVVRDGQRVQMIDAALRLAADGSGLPAGASVMRCRALRIRSGDVPVPDIAAQDEAPPRSPHDLPRFRGVDGWASGGFWDAVDVRFVRGMLGEAGPGAAWGRLMHPIAEGVTTTPLVRAAAVADFGNGVGSPLPMEQFIYINPDLTLHLHRQPVGVWIGIAAASVAQPTGIGLTTSTLFDTRGRIGSASQSLYVDSRRQEGPS